jgi:nucleotidyltransferase substrate binding protein (TIGR01987 family)
MNLLRQQRIDLENILARWQEALIAWRTTGSDRDRDSAILRFELAYEVMWKHLQALAREQGLESAGPRQAFENAFRLGWIEDEVIWVEAIQARNRAVHVYREALAQSLGEKLVPLHTAFVQLVKKLPAG